MTGSNLYCRPCESDADRAAALAIRFEVFVDEQGVPPELEADEYDAVALHLLALAPATGEAVGTARLLDKGAAMKIGRVAVRRPWRGAGAGRVLMEKALEIARAAGKPEAILDAQLPVIPFYERLGFAAEGPVFDDAGIPHRRMRRSL